MIPDGISRQHVIAAMERLGPDTAVGHRGAFQSITMLSILIPPKRGECRQNWCFPTQRSSQPGESYCPKTLAAVT
jgi:hypothetical protein